MKTKIVLIALFVGLATMGFDCINDGFEVAINLSPFNGTYILNTGAPNWNACAPGIEPASLYDQSYNLTGASVYDIRIQTSGPDLGPMSGAVSVNGIQLLSFSGTWTQFNVPQSLLTSPHITRNAAGITELVSAVLEKRTVSLCTSGGATNTVPNGCSIVVSAYVQAYGTL